jgi:uncharacterized protein (TIGR04141 family)
VFLIKAEIVDPEDTLLGSQALVASRVISSMREIGILYIKPTSDRNPSWLSFFDGALRGVPDVHNASAAAVFLLRSRGRIFALTFGYGRSLLKPGTWEEDFGLRVTLNAVDPQRIRSIDRVKFDAISQHSQIQASRYANILEFGLDVEQDLLRAVTGKPRDVTLASQLTGKDALKVDASLDLSSLPELLSRFWDIFNETTYRDHFQWVDQVGEIRDSAQLDQLNAQLIEKINRLEFEGLWLAIPDRVDWEGIAGFRYRRSAQGSIYPDIHFRSFLEEQGEGFVATIDILRNRKRVYLVSYESDAIVTTWPLYRCIYCEINSGDRTFLLNNGKWYRVRSDFLELVNSSFTETLRNDLGFPEFSHESETAYNRSVAESQPEDFFLMDQNFITPVGRDRIEFCDLYSRSKQIIHVKKYRGSATLSHLFAQGVVSGELFCALSDFRESVNQYLSEPFRVANSTARPASDEFEVVFGIISKSRAPLTLPFFSRVNLRNAAQRLTAFGYKVSVAKIQDATP